MATRAERIIRLLRQEPGMTDREITDRIDGRNARQQPVNQICRQLEREGVLVRRRRPDGLIGNHLTGRTPARQEQAGPARSRRTSDVDAPDEDEIKRMLDAWLRRNGWKTRIAWGRNRGPDIEVTRGDERWIIEVKGAGLRPQMRVNYFLAILGEILQRMNDPATRYSIALPDLPQYRRLWERLPHLAKTRNQLTALFADLHGNLSELD